MSIIESIKDLGVEDDIAIALSRCEFDNEDVIQGREMLVHALSGDDPYVIPIINIFAEVAEKSNKFTNNGTSIDYTHDPIGLKSDFADVRSVQDEILRTGRDAEFNNLSIEYEKNGFYINGVIIATEKEKAGTEPFPYTILSVDCYSNIQMHCDTVPETFISEAKKHRNPKYAVLKLFDSISRTDRDSLKEELVYVLVNTETDEIVGRLPYRSCPSVYNLSVEDFM